MNDSQLNQTHRKSDQAGAYIVVVAISLVAMLALVGLSIDAARLFLVKRELQSTVDAAALSTARLFLLDPSIAYNTARSRANDLIGENLRRLGFSQSEIDRILSGDNGQKIQICFQANGACGADPSDPNLKGLHVSSYLTTQVPTTILGAVPFVQHSTLVSASALADNLKLVVGMVLDVSGSMLSGITPMPGCPSCNQRGEAMIYAATEFVDGLLPVDIAGLVIFGQNLWGSDPSPGSGPDWSIVAANYSNDANLSYNSQYMTPTNRSDLKLKINGLWPVIDDTQTNIGAGIQAAQQHMAGINAPGALKLMIVLSDGRPTAYYPLTAIGAGPRPLPASCNLEPLMQPPSPDATRKVKLQMIDAIYESDRARLQNILVYSIGLGPADPDLSSPFQTLDNSGNGGALKPFLMERIANDQVLMRLPTPVPGWAPYDPAYPREFPCKPTIPGGAQIVGRPNGRYLSAESGQELLEAFWEIAKMRTTLGKLPL